MSTCNKMVEKFYLLVCVTIYEGYIDGSTVKDRIFTVRSTEEMVWREAFEFCKERKMRMISKNDIQIVRTNNIYVQNTWLGTFQARTDYLTEIGCYETENRTSQEITTFTRERMTTALCFFYCMSKHLKPSFIGVKKSTCICFPEFEKHEANPTMCNKSYSDGSICRGNDAFSVYRKETTIIFEKQKAWCGIARFPYERMAFASCKEKRQFYCKDSDNNYKLWNISQNWYKARQNCLRRGQHGSKFLMAQFQDFIVNEHKLQNGSTEYWVATKIYMGRFKSTDIIVPPAYLHRCNVSHSSNTDAIDERIAKCDDRHSVVCIAAGIEIPKSQSMGHQNRVLTTVFIGCTAVGVVFLLLAAVKWIIRKKRSTISSRTDVMMELKTGDTRSVHSVDSNYDYIPGNTESINADTGNDISNNIKLKNSEKGTRCTSKSLQPSVDFANKDNTSDVSPTSADVELHMDVYIKEKKMYGLLETNDKILISAKEGIYDVSTHRKPPFSNNEVITNYDL